MARVRLIKPEVFRHEGLAELPIIARYLFIGLWTIADREGRLEDRPRRIKADLFPYEDNLGDVEVALGQLDERGFIRRYQVDGKQVIWIPKFLEHQKPHPREAKSLLPPIDAPKASLRQTQGEPFHGQATPRQPVYGLSVYGLSVSGTDSCGQPSAAPPSGDLFELAGSKSPGIKPDDLRALWNETAAKDGLPEWQSPTTGQRLKHAEARIRDRPAWALRGPSDSWEACFRRVAASDFLAGRKTDFKASSGWVLKPENFAKLLEGNYDNRDSQRAARTPTNAISEQAKAAFVNERGIQDDF